MSKKAKNGLEATLADYLLNPRKYRFGLKDL